MQSIKDHFYKQSINCKQVSYKCINILLSDNKHAYDTIINTCIVQLIHTHLMNAFDDKDLDIKPDPKCHHISHVVMLTAKQAGRHLLTCYTSS